MAILHFVLIVCVLQYSWADEPDIREPPGVQKPSRVPDKYFKLAGSFILPCNATGVPAPVFTWYQNNEVVDLNRYNIRKLDAGNIEVFDASSLDEGDYQCVAANTWGKSISQMFHIQAAKIGSFPADKAIKDFTGVKGQPLKIQRVDIKSIPKPSFSWKMVRDVNDQYPRELTLTRRVTQDLEGNLYFTALMEQDALSGKEFYKVDVFNNELDTTSGGSYSRVTVVDGPDYDQPVKLLYPESKTTTKIILEGEDLKLQCIYGGLPSAKINWSGPAKKYDITDFDTTFIVHKVTRADEGQYKCSARNSVGTDEAIINVDVQSIPKFTPTGRPGKRVMSEGDSVFFKCETTVDTEPPATVQWMINNVPVNEQLPGPRTEIREIANGKMLTIVDLKREDIKVIQCNVSNSHKTLYADAPLNVLLRTTITARPESQLLMENETKVVFTCNATTDPSTKGTIKWMRDGKPIIFYDDPNLMETNGMLTINLNTSDLEVKDEYAGVYGCNASNGYSFDFQSAKLAFLNRPGKEDEVIAAASNLWLIILIVVLVLLFIIIFLICCICLSRNKGGSYPVDEKERANGNDPIDDLEKAGFHDYVRPPIAKRKDSRASLSSTVFMGSTSSLPDFGDFGEGGMSEDGSFIGMYTDDRRKLKPSYSEA